MEHHGRTHGQALPQLLEEFLLETECLLPITIAKLKEVPCL